MSCARSLAALLFVWASVAASACASEPGAAPGVVDGGPEGDAGAAVDAGDGGAAVGDAAADADDRPDARDDILGTLSGTCGVIAAELGKPTPAFVENKLVFAAGEQYAKPYLTPGGQTLFDAANAGGSSSESEVMSFEVLHHCDGATLLKTETQIKYEAPDAGSNAITDILVEIAGQKVGVSVTRAYKPANLGYTDADAVTLLTKKLEGVNRSSERVLPADKWVKQVLHVFAATDAQEAAVRRVWPTLDAALRADTVVVLTRTTGGGFVYCDPDPALGSECP